jgi:hypothetical protein
MTTTRDGFELKIGQEYTIVSLDMDDQFVESSTKCIYWGHWVRANNSFIAGLGNSCSGAYIPAKETMHRFIPVVRSEDFDILESIVRHIVIKDESEIEEVVKRQLKN